MSFDLDLNCPAEASTPAEVISATYDAAKRWLDAKWAPDSDARKSLFTKALYGSVGDLLRRHPLTGNTLFDDAIAEKDVCVLLALISRLTFLATEPSSDTTAAVQSSPCIGSTASEEDEETEDEEIAAVSLTRICRPVRLSSWVEIEELPVEEPKSTDCTHPGCDMPGNRYCSENQCQRHCIARLVADKSATCQVSYHRARARSEAQEQQRRKRLREEEVEAEAEGVKRSKRIKQLIRNRRTNAPRCEAPQCKMHSHDKCITGRCSEHCANIQWRNRGIRCPHHPPHRQQRRTKSFDE